MEIYRYKLRVEKPFFFQLLTDIASQTSIIIDAVPFVAGNLNASTREGLSWDYTDTFEYCSYEKIQCDLRDDILKWSEPTMGNCFTFNHKEMPMNYAARRAGADWGKWLSASHNS